MSDEKVPFRPLLERVCIRAEMRVESALHVGSGVREADEAITRVEKDDSVDSTRIAHDGAGRPYIPGSSLKGVLRARLENVLERLGPEKRKSFGLDNTNIEALFGSAKDGPGGAMGSFIVYGARFKAAPAQCDRPGYAAKNKALTRGIALSARTAIDGGRGTADHHKLFHAEEVVSGTTFAFEARFLPPPDAAKARIAAKLLAMLLHVVENEGLAIGQSTGDGAGRVAFGKPALQFESLDPATGAFAERTSLPGLSFDLDQTSRNVLDEIDVDTKRFVLRLKADGPFFVNDWDWAAKAGQRKAGQSDDAAQAQESQLRVLQEKRGEPILPGASLMGVLRARAEWIARRDAARCGAPGESADKTVGLLFGTPERTAALRLDSLERLDGGRPMAMTSVKLDRFSGAPIEGALFCVECVAEPVFEARLRLVPPRGAEDQERAEGLWKKLRDELANEAGNDGVMLGHAANRGFGWFSVDLSETAA